MTQTAVNSPAAFGKQLRLLRRRARLTQAELGIAVGYSDAQICRLETGRRPPDLTTLIALFLPALDIEAQSHEAQQLLELAAIAREELIAEPSQNNHGALNQALPTLASHLPSPTSHFLGRGAEQQRILQWLNNSTIRLISIVGLAGIGKTQLGLQCLHQFASQSEQQCVFVDLVTANDPESMVQAINKALEISESPDEHPLSLAISQLEQQPSCLLLDNCEQIQDASRVISQLLSEVPTLKLIVTSQIALRLSAEHVLQLTPLAVPNLLALPPLAELAQIEAMALLLARLQVHNPKLELTEKNALALAALCVRVDGVPLALELVAASGRLFDPEALLSELASHFLSMRRRGRDLPSRHYSVTTALAWSYQQLDSASQRLFERLSVFVSGWTVEAALAVCGPEYQRHELIEQLNVLLDHSLIQQQTSADSTRMSMLTMVRTFAQEQANKHAEHDLLKSRMLDYLIELAQQAEQPLRSGNNQAMWIQRIEAEHDNIRAGLNWAWQHNAHQRGIQLVGYVWRFWYMRGYLREGRRWFENLLISHEPTADVDFARALDGVGILAWRQSDYQQAEQWYQQALAIYQTKQHTAGQAQVLGHLGLVAMDTGAYAQAAAYYEQSLPLYQAVEDQSGVVATLHNLGNLYCQQSENQRASQLYQECLQIYQEMGDQSGVALIALGLGVIARDEQRLDAAQASFEQSLNLARELGDDWNEATALINLGNIAIDTHQPKLGLEHYQTAKQIFERLGDQQSLCLIENRISNAHWLQGDYAQAQAGYRQCLMLAHAIGFDGGIIEGLEGLAHCLSQTLPTTAAQLMAYAAQMRSTKGYPIIPADEPGYNQIGQEIQAHLSTTAWQQAYQQGQQLSLQRAVSLALAN
ncbi:MAG: tetratricopeptide repeat protein [Chloroflexi bacterium]|nr:tetratricopeptide repeat protein [Chloroflexota bacterium]